MSHLELRTSLHDMSCQSQILNYITYPSCDLPVSAECIEIMPQLREIQLHETLNFPTEATFSIFNKSHAKEAARIIDQLIFTNNFSEFLMSAFLYRDRLPQVMFFYIFSAAMIHQKNFKGTWVSNPFYVMPKRFFTDTTLNKIASNIKKRLKRDEDSILNENTPNKITDSNASYNLYGLMDVFAGVTTTESSKTATTTESEEKSSSSAKNESKTVQKIHRDETGNFRDPEHNLWYFREDIAINSFHWYWHTNYPPEWTPDKGKSISHRKGELFFHMHRQIIRRYNADRFAFNMTKVKPLDDWDADIPEGYFPHLVSNADEMEFPSRPANMVLHDIDKTDDGTFLTKDNLRNWTEKIKKSIKDGFAKKKNGNKTVELDIENGTAILGAMIESSDLSPDSSYYGILHNVGHIMIADISDPKGMYNSPHGVMGYIETSMRDPIFYRWHQFIDDIFRFHKDTLPSYSEDELNWEDISIKNAFVINGEKSVKNELCTYYEKKVLDISLGLDFSLPQDSVLVEFEHLNHDNFTYIIKVDNPTKRTVEATVRIYFAPKNNEEGEEASDKELFDQFFEMDVFKVKIRPGLRIITRSSSKSSVTLEPEETWKKLQLDTAKLGNSTDAAFSCYCGWPDHMLVPHGTKTGMPFYMLVFITDYKKDKVNNSKSKKCINGVRMCGIVGESFPDKRPLGFPFDRKIAVNKKLPYSKIFFKRSNMHLSELNIFHLEDKDEKKENSTKPSSSDLSDIDFS